MSVALGCAALLVGLSGICSADDSPDRAPGRVAVTGNSDWSIVPAALTPQFVFIGTDGDFYIRHLPLVGNISLTGRSVSIEGKISADFNAELDPTFSGPVWAPVTITGRINGTKTLLFPRWDWSAQELSNSLVVARTKEANWSLNSQR